MSQTEFVNRRYALGARLTAGIQACGPNGQEITSGWETVLEQYWVKGTAGGTGMRRIRMIAEAQGRGLRNTHTEGVLNWPRLAHACLHLCNLSNSFREYPERPLR